MDSSIVLGANEQGEQTQLNPAMANRHGLIAGATGTGKTVTLQVLAENFSRLGIPVFLADIKGDLSGLLQAGAPHPKIDERIKRIGLNDYQAQGFPVQFWDLFGQQGVPVRATVTAMGYELLAQLLELNDTQTGVLMIMFKVAEIKKWLLLDLKDLRSSLLWLSDNYQQVSKEYGGIAASSIAAIQRRLLALDDAGGNHFFGEPALELQDFIQCTEEGMGHINILAGNQLIQKPTLYGTFLLWLLRELFKELPEVGDKDKPRFVFFFDEAHLLFDSASKALLQTIEQTVRLIRSKGVGVYFVSQNPSDIPDDVLGQLGNRIQHALRAYTPKDQKALKAAAQSFRANPAFDTQQSITELGVGEALVSVLDEKGTPTFVERILISPPRSRMGVADPEIVKQCWQQSPLQQRYGAELDRESAHERLQKRQLNVEVPAPKSETRKTPLKPKKSRQRQGFLEVLGKSLIRAFSSSFARSLSRSILKNLNRKK